MAMSVCAYDGGSMESGKGRVVLGACKRPLPYRLGVPRCSSPCIPASMSLAAFRV